jgi:hypothetical protein
MLGGMRVGLVLAVLLTLPSCGGNVTRDPLGMDQEAGGSVGVANGGSSQVSSGGTAGDVSFYDAGMGAAPDEDAGSGYQDPGCPDEDPPPPLVECDPFGDGSDCDLGLACYPYVDHPFGEGCGIQQYGALCQVPGTGQQGARCGDGVTSCAAGFVCVVGTTTGARCGELCPLDGTDDCPLGLICGELDVEGFGVCG